MARHRFDDNGARQMVLDCDVAGVEVLLVAGDDASDTSEASRLLVEVDGFGPAELLRMTIRRLMSHAARRTGDADAALAEAEQAVALAVTTGPEWSSPSASTPPPTPSSCSGEPLTPTGSTTRHPPGRPRRPTHVFALT